MARSLPWSVAGLLLVAAGLWALIEDVPVWNAVWYLPAWYGYLLLVDAAIFVGNGRSFLSHRRRELAAMLFWSLPFWYFFEACNLVLRDWYYVFVLRSRWASALMGVLAFATVLPACLFHAEQLDAWGIWKERSCRPRVVSPALRRAVGAGALCCLVLPLLAPRVAFPLIWFAPIGLDAINYRSGSPSLLRDLEQGRCGRILRLLVGGLWAGAIWELINSFARCKWIYTVPGFEGSKLFEMPAAGFLGFPILAIGAFAFFSFVDNLRASGWKRALPIAALVFCAAADLVVEPRTARSRRPLLAELQGLNPTTVERLRAAGIPTPEWLSRRSRKVGIGVLSERVGLSTSELAQAASQSDLAIHKGMGAPRAALLRRAGIGSVAQLADAEPDALCGRLTALAEERGEDPPRAAEVRVWVLAARRSGGKPAR